MKKFVLTWLPVIIWCATIYFFSAQETIKTPFIIWWDLLMKKTAHFTEFAILVVLTFRALYAYIKNKHFQTLLIWALVFSVFYAISDEFHQRFTPGRTSTYRDVLIDSAGILCAYWVIKTLKAKPAKQPLLATFIFGKKTSSDPGRATKL